MEKEFAKGMRGNPTPAVTQISAAMTIWKWIEKHGRPPKVNECRNKNELYGYDLYYRVFAVSHFSSIIPLVSALCGSSVKMRTCLGHAPGGGDCPNRFPDMGAHVRLCNTCRQQPTHVYEYALPPKVERLTSRERWSYFQSWAQDIDWTGGQEAG